MAGKEANRGRRRINISLNSNEEAICFMETRYFYRNTSMRAGREKRLE